MKITSFDRAAVKNLRDDINAALSAVSSKYGIQLSVGNATFTSNNVTYKVQAAVKASDGMVMTKEASAFNTYGKYQLPGFNLGQTIILQGNEYVISGWKPKSTKSPVLVTRGGKTYKVSVNMVKMYNK